MGGYPAAAGTCRDSEEDAGTVHAWRVTQLTRLGLALPIAEAVAETIDWHQVANLVARGCPAELAVRIVQ